MRKIIPILFLVIISAAYAAPKSEEVVRSFLTYQYGGEVLDIDKLCIPCPDLWMLRGVDQPQKRDAIKQLEVKVGSTGVFMNTVEQDICIVELKDGHVDPQFNLAMVQQIHKQMILGFVYNSLLQDKDEISRLVTNTANVSFGGAPKAGNGDMDVYANILALIPVLRVSEPQSDVQTKFVTYRMPIGSEIFIVRIVKRDGKWKIDTDKKIIVPLKYFWQ